MPGGKIGGGVLVATEGEHLCHTTDKVEELVKRGVKKIAIVAPAFLADGLETLEELDIGIREHFLELGGEELTVVKCLNDDQDWVEGLYKLVEKRFSGAVTA